MYFYTSLFHFYFLTPKTHANVVSTKNVKRRFFTSIGYTGQQHEDTEMQITFINIGRQTTNEDFPRVDLDALRGARQCRKSSGAAERRRQRQLLL